MKYLDLSGNPITVLPEVPDSVIVERGRPGKWLLTFDISSTGVTNSPSWMQNTTFYYGAATTPICARVLANNLVVDEEYLKERIDCTTITPVGYGN